MNYKVISLLVAICLLICQVMMWKKIKLEKWQDYTLSAILASLLGILVYLTFI